MNKRLLNILIPANLRDRRRLFIDLLLACAVFGGYFWYTNWTPALRLESERDNRPYHWMVHEATHQLNNELSHFELPWWAEEGIASYFSTSKTIEGEIKSGVIDRDTYPVWWLCSLELSGSLLQDKSSQKIISIKSVVNDEKPLKLNEHVNLYYIHWFSLVHFLLEGEQGKYRESFIECVKKPSGLDSFEKNIGPYSQIEPQWYRHLCRIIADLSE